MSAWTLAYPVSRQRLNRSTLRLLQFIQDLRLLLLLSSARAGMATDTMTGIVIGSVGNGSGIITMNANGTTHRSITTGIVVSGVTVAMVMGRTMAGTDHQDGDESRDH
jgi:hypothetical protein